MAVWPQHLTNNWVDNPNTTAMAIEGDLQTTGIILLDNMPHIYIYTGSCGDTWRPMVDSTNPLYAFCPNPVYIGAVYNWTNMQEASSAPQWPGPYRTWTLKVESLDQLYLGYHDMNVEQSPAGSYTAPNVMASNTGYIFPTNCKFGGLMQIDIIPTGTCNFGSGTVLTGVNTWHNSSTTQNGADPTGQRSHSFGYSGDTVSNSVLFRSALQNPNVKILNSNIEGCRVIGSGDIVIENSCILDEYGCTITLDLRYMAVISGDKVRVSNCNIIGIGGGYTTYSEPTEVYLIGLNGGRAQYEYVDKLYDTNNAIYLDVGRAGIVSLVYDTFYAKNFIVQIIMDDAPNQDISLNNCSYRSDLYQVAFYSSPTTGGYDLSGEDINTDNPKLNIVVTTSFPILVYSCYGWKPEFEPEVATSSTSIPVDYINDLLLLDVVDTFTGDKLSSLIDPINYRKLFDSKFSGSPNEATVKYYQTITANPCYIAP